jgi:preprotein translocase subunit SecB
MAMTGSNPNGGGAPGEPGAASGDANPQDSGPSLQVLAQYIRDLSFENPGIGTAFSQPRIDLNVDLQARRTENGQYEVTLKLRVNATQDTRTLFLLELAYAGAFALRGVPEESVQPVLLIECPRLLFPFARRIVGDVVRDGGMPPLMIEPIDFAALYRAKMVEGNAPGAAPAAAG